MSTSTTAAAPTPEVEHAPSGPRITLRVLRVLAVLHSLAVIAQPTFAGLYLGGEVDAMAVHELNAHIASGLGVFQLVAAIVYVWGGRGRTWPLYGSIGLVLAEQVQVGFGYEGPVAVHIPLGVSVITLQVLLTVWLFRASARTRRGTS